MISEEFRKQLEDAKHARETGQATINDTRIMFGLHPFEDASADTLSMKVNYVINDRTD